MMPGQFDGDVRAAADGDAHVGAGQGGGVVDAIADHRHPLALLLQFGHFLILVLGQHLGEVRVDAQLLRHRLGDRLGCRR